MRGKPHGRAIRAPVLKALWSSIMRRRDEWFESIDFHLVLWWIPAGDIPTLVDALAKRELLSRIGPSEEAFTFKTYFPSPCVSGEA